MEFRDYLRMMRRGWLIVALITLAAVGAAAAYVSIVPRTYQASSVILVSVQGARSVGDLQQGTEFSATAAKTYASIAASPTVLEPVAEDLRLAEGSSGLAGSVDVVVKENTPLIQVTASATTAQQASDVANAVVKETIKQVTRLEATTSLLGLRYVRLRQVQSAEVPTIAVSPNVRRTLALGLLVGLVVGVSATVLVQSLDTRIRGPRTLWGLTKAPLLAAVPRTRRRQTGTLVIRDDPGSPVGEAFRTLRTNIRFVEPSDRHSLLVAPVAEARGGVNVAANLAWALADVGYEVVVVDGDLRRGRLSALFGPGPQRGLSEVLSGQATLDETLADTGHAKLTVLPAGTLPSRPSELLASLELATIVATLESSYDFVVVDSPAVLTSTDAAVLAAHVRRTLVVATSGRTRGPQLTAALGRLENAGESADGIVLTQVRRVYSRDEFTRPSEDRTERVRTVDLERADPAVRAP